MASLNLRSGPEPKPDLGQSDGQWLVFTNKIKKLSGVDLEAYKPEQMRRRLNSLMGRMGASDWIHFGLLLERDPKALQDFKDFMTINVSEFFRGADKFLQLRDEVIPQLAADRDRINVWSAGCSVGAEPYTLAMILDNMGLASRVNIIATDIDRTVLDRARRGDGYSDSEVKEVPRQYLLKYFRNSPDGWEVAPEILSLVDFRVQNLLKDPYPMGMDLIVCRNVVIYLTDQAKSMCIEAFSKR